MREFRFVWKFGIIKEIIVKVGGTMPRKQHRKRGIPERILTRALIIAAPFVIHFVMEMIMSGREETTSKKESA